MPRYIDTELALKLKDEKMNWCYDLTDLEDFLAAVPSADVVPRRTVERLQSEINRLKKYDEERDIELHARLISETKTEVAREIFEEIEKIIGISRQCEYSKEFGFLVRYYYNGLTIVQGLDELKKKYMEGGEQ